MDVGLERPRAGRLGIAMQTSRGAEDDISNPDDGLPTSASVSRTEASSAHTQLSVES